MKNPISDIIPNNTFRLLDSLNLINKRTLRDLTIRQEFQHLRSEGFSPEDSIDQVHRGYPSLSRHTLKKIIYSTKLPEEK